MHCTESCGGFVIRRYYTRQEKREWLEEYAQGLENELKAVRERIGELKG
ncbi:MAG: DUF5320 domain-containing protein [Euryarchaeota archaeon]|nr:DUF5320 domain-containing protein [Euryarchaeota archaeon]